VQRAAQARFPGVYAGEVLVDHGFRVVVYLTRPTAAAETAITAGVQPGVVRFARAPRSLAFLNRLHKRVTAEAPKLARRGIDLVTWGPDFITGHENITVQHLTTAKKAVLDSLFGTANLTLSTTTSNVAGIAVNRAHDSPPWNGGDYIINDPATGICTSGFGAHSGSAEYLITAGHCFGVNELIVNGSPKLTGVYTGVGNLTTRGSYGKKNGIDAEMLKTNLDGGSSKAIYTGSSMKPTISDVSGTASSPAGDQVCDSGAFEGEVCDIVIKKTTPMPECIKESEGPKTFRDRPRDYSEISKIITVCDIFEAKQASGKLAVGNGDSGGPVFRFNGSKLYATGIITAMPGTGTVKCPTEQYPNLSTRFCSPTLFYTDISNILSEFKVSINT
jgi:hypothetical protein